MSDWQVMKRFVELEQENLKLKELNRLKPDYVNVDHIDSVMAENVQLKELNREMENALIEIKEYWGGRQEGALDAIQHVKSIAEWILDKVEEGRV